MSQKGKYKLPKFPTKPADPDSPNPYFRAFVSPELATEKSRERSRILASRLKLISKIKPKKTDKGKIVFFAVRRVKRGKKIFTQIYRPKGKALLRTSVYVAKPGKKKFKILNMPDPKTLAKGVASRPAPQRLDQFDVRKLQKQPVNYSKYLKRLDKLFAKKMITKRIKLTKETEFAKDGQGNLMTDTYIVKVKDCNLSPFFDSAISVWKQLVESQFRQKVNWQLEGQMLYLKDGKTRSVGFAPGILETARFYEVAGSGKLVRAIGKSKAARKVYTDKFLRDLYSRWLYKGMAIPLAQVGLVSISSVRRIKAMPENQGKPKRNWSTRTMKGKKMRWWGEKATPICILEIQFRFKSR